MDNSKSGPAGMEVVIAANQVQTLHYKLYAYALLSPPAAADTVCAEIGCPTCPQPHEVLGQTLRETVAVPYAGKSVGSSDRHSAAARSGFHAPVAEAESPALWTAAVRALRAKTSDAVQAQVARLIEATGRDWEIRRIDYGEPRSGCTAADARGEADDTCESGAGSCACARITLVTQVVLRACTPVLH